MNIQAQKNNEKYRKELVQKATPCELIVKNWLEENDIYFIFQKGFIMPFHRIVDFYLPGRRIILEIDGKYHLDTVAKDNRKDYLWARERNMHTIRITNEQVESGEFKTLLACLL